MLNFQRTAIETALNPGRFFAAEGALVWQHHQGVRLRWEIFRGHLLDERQTRAEAVFDRWSVLLQTSDDMPACAVVSLNLPVVPSDQDRRLAADELDGSHSIYVTRELLVHGQETYEPAPNTIATRPAQLVQRELVGAIDCRAFETAERLAAEIADYVLLALVGTSRLPIVSVESPLPAFSLGQVGYAPKNPLDEQPISEPALWTERSLRPGPATQQARVLELALRAAAAGDVPAIAQAWRRRAAELALSATDTVRIVRALFNQVALTPYTALVERLLAFLDQQVSTGGIAEVQRIDLLGFMLRQLARHLNAFDLVVFHNRGANYPDALLLESLLDSYAPLIEQHPAWFLTEAADLPADTDAKRMRRRALRGAAAVWLQYAGHRVPDVPTSPGENARVMADPALRVAEDQLLHGAARRRQLFAADLRLPPAAQQALAESIDDLTDPREGRELGMALLLDRPLGLFHEPGELDRTPLVSYEAFSRKLAQAQVGRLGAGFNVDTRRADKLLGIISQVPAAGLPVASLPLRNAPGVVSLDDAGRVSDDFVLRRTTRGSLDELLSGYDLSELKRTSADVYGWLMTASDVLLARTAARHAAQKGEVLLSALDGSLRIRIKLALADPARPIFFERTGSERLRAGLRVTQIDGTACDILVPAR